MNKKLISGLLTVAMAINIFAIMPLNAFAIGSESKVYEKDGYTVTYRIGSEWDNNRSVEVTIENTGDEAILNWALKYDTGGEVYNLWNSKIYDSTEDYTIIKNNGYNYEIEPGRSANYGYIVTGAETLIPENIELCCRRIDVKSGYDVDFNVTSDWYTGFQAEIAITNTSAEPIEAWTLDFDSNFDINNIWNAKLLSSEEQSYVTANQLWTTPINPGASASFGFTADKSATENACAENFTLTAVVVGESSLEKEPEIDYELDTDSDGLPDYYEEIIGSDPKTEHSDDDQLPDGYEALYLGTDPSKSDSDDNGISDADEDFDTDGLTNLEEYNLGTDPFLEDSDYDTLSDKDEVNIYGTNPTKGDTDDDLVPDGDEVKLGLDPNSGSTNGTPDSERTFSQIVTAESEVFAAVNDDAETPFDVSLEITAAGVAESNVYARESGYSNAIENPSIIGIAPEFVYTDGLAVEEVTVKFELDDSIVDNTLGIYAENNDGFEDIKRFNVFMFFEDAGMLLPLETQYDEVNNIVYTTTNTVGTYCLVDMELFLQNLGIEPADGIVEPAYEEEVAEITTEPVFSSYNISELKINTGYTEYKDNFDVVFIIDRVYCNNETIDQYCDKILNLASIVWNTSPNVSCTVYTINGDATTHFEKYDNLKNCDDLSVVLESITQNEASLSEAYISKAVDNIISTYDASGTKKIYAFAFFDSNYNFCQCKYNSKAELYGVKYGGKSINISVTSEFSDELKTIDNYIDMPYTVAMYKMTNGIYIDNGEKFVDDALKHIYGERPENVYELIIGSDYSTISLLRPLTPQDIEYAKELEKSKHRRETVEKEELFSDEELESFVDTDDDGLWDIEEIRVYKDTEYLKSLEYLSEEEIQRLNEENELIKINAETGEIEYPTVSYMFDNVLEGIYLTDDVQKFKEKFMRQYGLKDETEFWQKPVLPVLSNPDCKDSDGDDILDHLDKMPLYKSTVPQLFKTLIINEVVTYEEILRIDKECYICSVPLHELITSDIVFDFITTEKNLESADLDMIQSCLYSDNSDEAICLVGIYVGNDEMYFTAPAGISDAELAVLVNENADYHRKEIFETSELKNNFLYKALKSYSNNLAEEMSTQDELFDSYLEYRYNSKGLFKAIGFYDNDAIKVGTNLLDSFNKSAHKFIYSISSLISDSRRIDSIITTTTVSYIEYSYWHRQQYPEDNELEIVWEYIGKNIGDAIEYTLLDIDTRLVNGTAESRGEILGEALFEICLDVAIGKAVTKFANVKGATAVDDLDKIKSSHVTSNAGNANLYQSIDIVDGKRIYIKASNVKKYYKLINEYDDVFKQIIIKYDKFADDIIDLADSHGMYVINMFKNEHALNDDILEQFINVEKSVASPWKITDDYRGKRGLLKFGDSGDKNTAAFIKIDDDVIYGLNSGVLDDSEKGLGRIVYEGMKDEGYLEGTRHYGDGKAQILTHAEGHAIMQAYDKYGDALDKPLFLYCDNKTCYNCRKHLHELKEYFELDNIIVIINKNGDITIIQ